jgi:predicted RNase H-like HicB family nuclease
MIIKVQAIYKEQSNGSYYAECPELDGCYTQGGTFEEAAANLKDLAASILADKTDSDKRRFAGARCLVGEVALDA